MEIETKVYFCHKCFSTHGHKKEGEVCKPIYDKKERAKHYKAKYGK